MKISCNKLKKYIDNSDSINWITIWDKFSIRTAEVEEVEEVGKDLTNVVVAQITKCEKHPKKDNYSVLEVTDGTNNYSILCGAPNVRLGLKAPLIKVGGTIGDFTIEEKKIAGVLSQGMLCAGDELGINSDHDGIIELDDSLELGIDIKEVFPIEDVVIEIDNKSLTNRPDLWGHYGIAREIAAITNNKLLDLELYDIENNKKDLDISINTDKCLEYDAIHLSNIENNTTPMDIQIFLHRAGIRSISLLVDLTNYVMLELGQPMHAFDSNKVKSINVDLSNNEEVVTLDNQTRKLNKETVVIKNETEIIGIAGIMGGKSSEIESATSSVIIESATFDASTIRKSANALGHRTDASMRYEKSLDPNMCEIAIKRLVYLLKEINPNIVIDSNLTKKSNYKNIKKEVILKKEKLEKYMGIIVSDKEVEDILIPLGFHVNITNDSYIVKVPSYRATKDINMDADIIEEISRMYGYENIEEKPIIMEANFTVHESIYEEEYQVKSYLCNKYRASEVHSYLWYDATFLKESELEIENTYVINKNESNILRNNLSLSLLPFVKNNVKNIDEFIIYEIGTVINKDDNNRNISIILTNNELKAKETYTLSKEIVKSLFKDLKNTEVEFKQSNNCIYAVEDYSLDIIVNDIILGKIDVVNPKITYNIGKKKFITTIEIFFDEYIKINKESIFLKEVSKYQITQLDYTVIVDNKIKYIELENVINNFKNEFVNSYKLVDVYEEEKTNKYLIRFIVSSNDKTLSAKELEDVKEKFIKHIKDNKFDILEN